MGVWCGSLIISRRMLAERAQSRLRTWSSLQIVLSAHAASLVMHATRVSSIDHVPVTPLAAALHRFAEGRSRSIARMGQQHGPCVSKVPALEDALAGLQQQQQEQSTSATKSG